MPSKSEKQKRLMRAAAHNEEFADKVGIKQEIAREFVDADKELEKKKGKKKKRSKSIIEEWSKS